jgi:hypothetical protein
MVMIEQEIEASIVTQLRAALHPVTVDLLPDKEREPRYPNGGVLVAYHSSRFGNTRSTDDAVVQEEIMTFDVTLLSRSLRDHTGIYPLMRGAKAALLGFRPPHGGQLTLKNAQFVERENMVWVWSLEFETTTMMISVSPDEDLPLLKHLTMQDNFDDVQEIP